MGVFGRIVTAISDLWANTSGWVSLGGGHVDGEPVNEKSVLTIGTYYACVRNISEDFGKLPIRVLKNDDEKRRRIRIRDNIDYIFNVEYNPMMSAYQGNTTMAQWKTGWGRAYAEITRNKRGQITELWPIHPSRMQVKWSLDGITRVYVVHNDNGTQTELPASRVFHWYGMGDGYEGYSIVKLMTNTLGLAVATQNIAKKFFERGAMPSGVLETDQTLKKEGRENLKNSWQSLYGGPDNAGKTAVLEAGVKYKALSLPFKDVQLLELRKFQKEEIASWFRMPLDKLQIPSDAKGWATVAAQATSYVSDVLHPMIVNFEQEVKRQLLGDEGEYENVYVSVEVKGLLRGSIAERMEYYKGRFNMASITPNQIKELEDEDASDDPALDKYYIQGAMVPLDKAGQQQTGSKPPPEDEPPKKEEPEDDDDDAEPAAA